MPFNLIGVWSRRGMTLVSRRPRVAPSAFGSQNGMEPTAVMHHVPLFGSAEKRNRVMSYQTRVIDSSECEVATSPKDAHDFSRTSS
ncbi:hypothetical protein BHE74_00037453 [Ensete ventricosum]|nr:hypothetical protein BHE74_00037453 [Ensete ventricosum]